MAQLAPNSACFCPLCSSLQTLFLSVVQLIPNCLWISVRGTCHSSQCFCPLYSSFPTLCVFLSVVQFSVCVSVRGTVLCVCFCPWFSSLLALYVFLSVVPFSVCVSVCGAILCVCFCPWFHFLCVFLSVVPFSVCVFPSVVPFTVCVSILGAIPSVCFCPWYSSRLAQSLPGLWDTWGARHGSFLGLCTAHLLHERAENLQSSGACGCSCRRSVQATMVVFIRRHLLSFLSPLSLPSSPTYILIFIFVNREVGPSN